MESVVLILNPITTRRALKAKMLNIQTVVQMVCCLKRHSTPGYYRTILQNPNPKVPIGLVMCEVILTSLYECLTNLDPHTEENTALKHSKWEGKFDLELFESLSNDERAVEALQNVYRKWHLKNAVMMVQI